MATLRHRSVQGTVRFTATLRIKGFKSASRTFDDKKSAQAWAREQEAELRTARKGGAVPARTSAVSR